MGSLLDHCALMEHGDLVTEFTAGQAVADIDGGFIAGDVFELGVDLRLSNGIEAALGSSSCKIAAFLYKALASISRWN